LIIVGLLNTEAEADEMKRIAGIVILGKRCRQLHTNPSLPLGEEV